MESLYYATTSEIKAVLVDNTSATILSTVSSAKLGYDNQTRRLIYYASNVFKSANLDGTDQQTIKDSIAGVSELSVDHIGRKVYYVETLFRKVHSIPLSGGAVAEIGEFGDSALNIGVDPGEKLVLQIFYTIFPTPS